MKRKYTATCSNYHRCKTNGNALNKCLMACKEVSAEMRFNLVVKPRAGLELHDLQIRRKPSCFYLLFINISICITNLKTQMTKKITNDS